MLQAERMPKAIVESGTLKQVFKSSYIFERNGSKLVYWHSIFQSTSRKNSSKPFGLFGRFFEFFQFQDWLVAMIPNYSKDINPTKLIFLNHPTFIFSSPVTLEEVKLDNLYFSLAWLICCVPSKSETLEKRCTNITSKRSTQLDRGTTFLLSKLLSFYHHGHGQKI